MPLYSYVCAACNHTFETLIRSTETAACPNCGSTDLSRQLGTIAPDAKTPGMIKAGRRAAAREGHFSHYSKAERSKI